MSNQPQLLFKNALKGIARNEQIKSYLLQSKELYPLVWQAAQRFVTGENREDGLTSAQHLLALGYSVSLEYIGENIRDLEECHRATTEFLTLIDQMGSLSMNHTVSLDLSHIGLCLDLDMTYSHLVQIAQKASQFGITVMVSMEESEKTADILEIYKKTTLQYANVGISIQVHQHRAVQDVTELLSYPGKIRLVKGAYQEPAGVALPRSKELNERYLDLIEQVIQAGHPLSIATHDEELIREAERRLDLRQSHVEVEMLYGIRPDLLKELKDSGIASKVYLTYGTEWYLYVCHRIAEYPDNLFRAVTDMIAPTNQSMEYESDREKTVI